MTSAQSASVGAGLGRPSRGLRHCCCFGCQRCSCRRKLTRETIVNKVEMILTKIMDLDWFKSFRERAVTLYPGDALRGLVEVEASAPPPPTPGLPVREPASGPQAGK